MRSMRISGAFATIPSWRTAPIANRYAAEQPVLLTVSAGNANGAQIRFLVDGAEPPDISGYERAVFLFDGHDTAQVDATARGVEDHESWRQHGNVLYWQPTPDKRWERKT